MTNQSVIEAVERITKLVQDNTALRAQVRELRRALEDLANVAEFRPWDKAEAIKRARAALARARSEGEEVEG